MKNYDVTGSKWNNPLQHNGSSGNYLNTNGILGFADSVLNFIGFGNANASSDLFAELTGYNSQQREFEQQEYLLEKEQEYASPQNQMEMMKAAGINPLTAAAGIAGNAASPQAPQVASNTQGAAAALSAGSQAASAVGDVIKSGSEANRINKMLEIEQQNMIADTTLKLEEAGLSHWNAISVATLLPTLQANQKADYYLKLANIRNVAAQYQNILAEHERILQHIETEKSIQGVNNANALKLQEDARFQKQVNDFFVEHGYYPDTPLGESLRNAVVTNHFDGAEQVGSAIESASNRQAEGQYSAEENHAYSIANARRNGENVSDRVNMRIGSWSDLIGRFSSVLGEGMEGVVNAIRSSFESSASNSQVQNLRNTISNAISDLHEQASRSNSPEVRNDLYMEIEKWSCLLQLSDEELLEWYRSGN